MADGDKTRDDVLRTMLRTPPKPHKPAGKKPRKKSAKRKRKRIA